MSDTLIRALACDVLGGRHWWHYCVESGDCDLDTWIAAMAALEVLDD
jgi:hypothetical protein